jgi:hypothetical protein
MQRICGWFLLLTHKNSTETLVLTDLKKGGDDRGIRMKKSLTYIRKLFLILYRYGDKKDSEQIAKRSESKNGETPSYSQTVPGLVLLLQFHQSLGHFRGRVKEDEAPLSPVQSQTSSYSSLAAARCRGALMPSFVYNKVMRALMLLHITYE